MESLEQRSLLAVVVHIDVATGQASVVDALTGTADTTEESNDITLTSSPTAGRLRVFGLNGGVVAGPGAVQIDPTTVDVDATSIVNIDLQGGDDNVTIVDGFLTIATSTINTLNIAGGESSGSDILYLQAFAPASGAQTVTISPVIFGFNSDQLITGYAAGNVVINSRGYESLFYLGNGGPAADDTLIVDLGQGVASADVSNVALDRDRIVSSVLPDIEFSGLNRFRIVHSNGPVFGDATVSFAPKFLKGATPANYEASLQAGDTLLIEGLAGQFPDNFTVTNPAGLPSVAVSDALGPVVVTEVNGFNGRLQIDTFGGDDQVNVNLSGVGAGNVNVPITFDGGDGSDRLTVFGTPATAVQQATYGPGPSTTEGRLRYQSAANATLGLIDFVNLEPVLDLVPAATLTVNGTNADNAINYSQGSSAATGMVSVDGFETIEFSNKGTLVLNGLAGSDTIHLNNASTPTGLTSITVSGGDPTASDTLIVNFVSGDPNYRPTDNGAGTIGIASLPDVTFSEIEHVKLVGLISDPDFDGLNYQAPQGTGADTFEYTPGSNADEGRITGFRAGAAGFNFTPLDFIGLRRFAQVVTNDVNDTVIVNGTAADNVFSVADSVAFPAFQAVIVDGHTQVIPSASTTGPALVLRGLGGNDTFNLDFDPASTTARASLIRIEGGDSDGSSDVLNFTGSGASAVTVDLATQTVQEAGFGPVSFSGVETVNIDANAALIVNGTAGDDTISVQPTAVGDGNFTATSSGPVVATHPQFTYTNADQLTPSGGAGGFDVLEILGNDGVDTVTSTATTVTRAGGTVTLGGVGSPGTELEFAL